MAQDRLFPRAQADLLDPRSRAASPEYRQWFEQLSATIIEAGGTTADVTALAARVAELETAGVVSFNNAGSVQITGGPGAFVVTLDGDQAAPGATIYYGTGPDGAKGFHAVADAIEDTADETTKTVGADGVTKLGLADLADSGAGTFKLITRDAKGRVSGSADGDTDDVPEGASSLYFTNARAQAAVVTASISSGDTAHSPSGDAMFTALAGKDDAGAAAAALTAAMDFTVDALDALTPVDIGMAAGFDSDQANRVTDLDAMLGGIPCFFSASSGATGVPVAASGSGVFLPFSSTIAAQLFTVVTGVDANRRVFYRTANATWGPWIEIAFRVWNAVTAASGSITPNLDINDAVIRTALSGALTINNPTGTKANGRTLAIRLRDNGTARALTWGAEYRSMTATLPTTTVANKTVYCMFLVNADESTLDLMNVQRQP